MKWLMLAVVCVLPVMAACVSETAPVDDEADTEKAQDVTVTVATSDVTPRASEVIKIKPAKAPKFKAGKN